ncbi:putative holin-like toxin [Heyndrickxia oleronia]
MINYTQRVGWLSLIERGWLLLVTVYEAVSLMIMFGTLIVAVIAVVISLVKRK